MMKLLFQFLRKIGLVALLLVALAGVNQTLAVPVQAQSANENILYNIFPSCENAAYSTESWGLCIREIVNWFFYVAIAIFFIRVAYIAITAVFSGDRASVFKQMRESIFGLIIGVIFIAGPVVILNLINPDFSKVSFSSLSEFATGETLIPPKLPEKDCNDQCLDFDPFDSYYATQMCTVSCQKSPENAAYYEQMFPGSTPCETSEAYRSCEAECRTVNAGDGLDYFYCVVDNCELSSDEAKECLGLCDPQNQYYLGQETCQRNADRAPEEEEEEPESTRVVWRVETDVFLLFPACAGVGENQEEFTLCIRQVTNFLLIVAIVIFFIRVAYLAILWVFSFGNSKQFENIKKTIPDLVIGVILVGMPVTLMFLINPTSNLLSFEYLSEIKIEDGELIDVTPPEPPKEEEEEEDKEPEVSPSGDAQYVDIGATISEGTTSICDWGEEFNSCSQRCKDTFGEDKYSPKCFEACRYAVPQDLNCGGLPAPCTYGPEEESYSQCVFSCGAGADIDTCLSTCKASLGSEGVASYNECTQKPYD